VTARPGVSNVIAIFDMGSQLMIEDTAAGIGLDLSSERFCDRLDLNRVTCDMPVAIRITSLDGDDVIAISTAVSSRVSAGPGNDTVRIQGAGNDVSLGASGDDVLESGLGAYYYL
jgi:Ca2+-binding RTX toxin-like protein